MSAKTGKALIGTRVRLKNPYRPRDCWGPPAVWGNIITYDPDGVVPYEIHLSRWDTTIGCDRDEFTVPRARKKYKCRCCGAVLICRGFGKLELVCFKCRTRVDRGKARK